MDRILLEQIARSWEGQNALEHSTLTLRRCLDLAVEDGVEVWSIVLPLGEGDKDAEKLYHQLRSANIPFCQIGIQTQSRIGSPNKMTCNYWGAFALREVPDMFGPSVVGHSADAPEDISHVVAEALSFDTVYFYYVPPTIFEGIAYQHIRERISKK